VADPIRTSSSEQLELLCRQFGGDAALPFAPLLSADRVASVLAEEGATRRDCVYTPALTLWAFLSQCLCPDGSCRQAVARVLAWLLTQGTRACSAKTDPYCKARQRLPLGLFTRLVRTTGRDLAEQLPDGWRWRGHRVKLVDGSTVTMPDTPALQAAYPQQCQQAPGLGFPIARIVVVFCLTCGTVLDAALGKYQGKATGENKLFRALADSIEANDVLVGDRYYGSYWELALLKRRGAHGVFRVHHARRVDFRTGHRLGPNDHIVTWRQPAQRPDGMDAATAADLPAALRVREVRVVVRQRGFRTRMLVLATTLLDPRAYPADALADLYRQRWHTELNLRSLKGPLGLDVLRCKSPAMVEKEFWARLLAYNLIRGVMAQAALAHGTRPERVSFKGTVQTLAECAPLVASADAASRVALWATILAVIARHRVGDRPDRIEPRAKKRRPKAYPLLRQPRAQARSQACR
jgi:Transposase DDE domain